MKRILLSVISIPIIMLFYVNLKPSPVKDETPGKENKIIEQSTSSITGKIERHDTLEKIFHKHSFTATELYAILKSSKKTYDLARLSIGNIYSFTVEKETNAVQEMNYEINENTYLKVVRAPEGFTSQVVTMEFSKRTGVLLINIQDNLIDSLPSTHKEYLMLAFKLSDIFAWDIDFSSDIRNNDSIKVLVEELWIGNVFKGFGNILMAEFLNNGTLYQAFRFETDGYADYYNERGESFRKTLLRSPLKFRYISSRYSRRRYHPILRIHRPHLGIDYAAPTGTPVSAAGDGTVVFAGYKGQNGRMVRIRHNRGLETFYGHLSRISRKIKRGFKVAQGDTIGYVGSTGLSTGPHLDYRMKKNGRFVNPLTVKLPRGKPVPKNLLAAFRQSVKDMEMKLTSLSQHYFAFLTDQKTAVQNRL